MGKQKTKRQPLNFKGLTDWVEIFRAGTQTSSNGTTQTFSETDLDQMVANHSSDHAIPHVITHNEMYSPFSYASGKELKREGKSLYVKSDQVEPQFSKLLEEGRLFNRSIRLTPAEQGYQVAHIAWLGAEPPAVKGMAPVSFADTASGLDFATAMPAWGVDSIADLFAAVRDFVIDKHDLSTADQILPRWSIDSLREIAKTMRDTKQQEFTQIPLEGNTVDITQEELDKQIAAATKAGKAAAQADFAKSEQKSAALLAKEKLAGRVLHYTQHLNDLKTADGRPRLTPAQMQGLPETLAHMEISAPADFSVGEDKTKTPLDYLQQLLGSIEPAVGKPQKPQGDDENNGVITSKQISDYQAQQAGLGFRLTASEALSHLQTQQDD